MLSLEKDIAIDMGTSTTLLYEKGGGVVKREPTVVSVDKFTSKIQKVGIDAQKSLGRTPANIIALHPLESGAICDYEMSTLMLREMIKSSAGSSFLKPRVLACVHSSVSGVEERAMIDATIEAGARRVYLVEAPIAIAAGAGVDVRKPNGYMVIDIGGGLTEVSVISSGGVVECESVKTGGNAFDEAIVKYIRKKYDMLISLNAAEELKRSIGAVIQRSDTDTEEIKGRDLKKGFAKSVTITSAELMEAFRDPVNRILETVRSVIEKTPPQLVADIDTNGIIMAGGGSLLYGMDKMIERCTNNRTFVVDDPISCEIYGAGKLLKDLDGMQEGMRNFYRNRQLKY